MQFVAIDFETANEKRHSVCSMGLAVVENGEIIKSKQWFIKPPELYFNKINISKHGIKENDVRDKPEFYQLWPEIKKYLENKIIVAHNASFDIYVLRDILDYYKIEHPELCYFCTAQIAKKVWRFLPDYKLKTLNSYLKIEIDSKRHEAKSDANICAKIAIMACKEFNAKSINELSKIIKLHSKNFPEKQKIKPKRYIPEYKVEYEVKINIDDLVKDQAKKSKRGCFTIFILTMVIIISVITLILRYS